MTSGAGGTPFLDLAGFRLHCSWETPALAALGRTLSAYLPSPAPSAPPLETVEVSFREGTATSLELGPGGYRVTSSLEELEGGLRGLLSTLLEDRDGALLHGAGIRLSSGAVLCIAPSGGGKSTLCRLLDSRAPVLSDETVAVRLESKGPLLAGTCFWSDLPLASATGLHPLRAICVLAKGREALEPIPPREALVDLLREWHLPLRTGAADAALRRAEALVGCVPAFRLRFELDSDPLPLLLAAIG